MTQHNRIIAAVLAIAMSAMGAAGLTACGAGNATDAALAQQSSAPTVTKAKASSAAVSSPAIQTNGTLKICTAFSTGNPPTYFTDAENKPVGAEVEMGDWVAHDLGLEASFVDVAFASIVPALQAGKCDVIMSSLYIKPERAKVVDFVPYLMSGSAVAVPKGNPKKITGMDDSLCGLKISAAVGKTATLQAEAQVEQCAKDGKPELKLVQTDQTTAAVQQLVTGQVDAYAGETPVVLYYQQKQQDSFEMAGKEFAPIEVGAAVTKGNSTLADALTASFKKLNDSGDYAKILAKWNMSSLAYKF